MSAKAGGRAGLLRALWGACCLAPALLLLIAAPTFRLWQLTLLVTEWGYWLAAAAALTLLPGWRRSSAGRVGGALGLGALLLALSPLARALPVARQLPAQLEAAFGPAPLPAPPAAPARAAPLVARDLLAGVPSPALQPQRRSIPGPGGQPLALDLYLPTHADGPAPGVVVIHGGSWQGGDPAQLAQLNGYLAARGYLVAAVSYRLAPQWRFPAARDDVLAAIDYLTRNAETLGLDPTRLALLGRSAGGQLALVAAYGAHNPSIRGVVSLYGPADLEFGYYLPTNPRVIDGPGVLEAYLGGSPRQVPAAYAAASPVTLVGPQTPPTLLIHGGRDELVAVAHSERLAARLAEARVPHLLLRLPWATHGFDFAFNGPGGQLSTYAIERFLAAVMASKE